MAKNNPVPHNPALVEFPRDKWGFTTALRKVGLQAASSVRGNQEKHDLYLNTLRVLAQHAAARLEPDAEAIKLRIEKQEAQHANRVQNNSTTPTVVVQPVTPEMEKFYEVSKK